MTENITDLKFHQPPIARNLVVVLVGTGGTGGYVARDLVRCLSEVTKKDDNESCELVFWDPDIVEEKNLVRQNFIRNDIGKYKAQVMGERYSNAFNFPIMSICRPFDPDTFTKLRPEEHRNVYFPKENILRIVISCTDNNESRREIFKALCPGNRSLIPGYQTYWIDSGNEKKSGQIITGYIPALGYNGLQPYHLDASYPMKYESENSMNMKDCMMPCSVMQYPSILDPAQDSKEEISCAEVALEEPQNMFVNINAATHVLNFFRQIVYRQKMYSYGIEFNINGTVKNLRNSPQLTREAATFYKLCWERNSVENNRVQFEVIAEEATATA